VNSAPGERAIRELVRDLEMMGLIETWIDSRGGGEGRVKQIETVFDPQWMRDAAERYFEELDQDDAKLIFPEDRAHRGGRF
jgi:Cdc6-like AAA superfamily ATPase